MMREIRLLCAPRTRNTMMRGPSVLTRRNLPHGDSDVVVAAKLSVVSHSCWQMRWSAVRQGVLVIKGVQGLASACAACKGSCQKAIGKQDTSLQEP